MKNLIKENRVDRGWSQARLAELLEVSRQNVIAIEKGKYDPSLGLAFRLADLFEKRVDDLFEPDR